MEYISQLSARMRMPTRPDTGQPEILRYKLGCPEQKTACIMIILKGKDDLNHFGINIA